MIYRITTPFEWTSCRSPRVFTSRSSDLGSYPVGAVLLPTASMLRGAHDRWLWAERLLVQLLEVAAVAALVEEADEQRDVAEVEE